MSFRNVLIVDTETNGLDAGVNDLVEIGAILYSVKYQSVIAQVSRVCYTVDGNECEYLNGIPSSLCKDMTALRPVYNSVETLINEMIRDSDAFIAHNAEFDRGFLDWEKNPWLCTCFDFKWPKQTREGNSLINLALEHGIGVSSAHRALTDCQLIAELFNRMDNLPEMLVYASRPKAMFQANVSFEDKDLAKDAGFKWNGDTKQWTRQMAIEDVKNLGFKTTKINA